MSYVINSISLLELQNLVNANELSILAQEGYRAYGKSQEESSKNFLYALNRANRYYQEKGALTTLFDLTLDEFGCYTFTDNLEQYHRGEINSDEVIVVPISISHLSNGRFISARFWEYRQPTLSAPSYAMSDLQASISLPIKVISEIAPDGGFTEDSRVYFVKNDNNAYIDHVTLFLLQLIKKRCEAIEVGQVKMFPQINDVIQELQNRINSEHDIQELGIMKKWRA